MDGPAELRRRLIDAAVRAVERDGPEELSLRRIASDAGVSHQAPYLCFADKRELLAAAAAVAMARDRKGWARAMARASRPVDKLVALARAHIRFARAEPNLHALAIGRAVGKADLPAYQAEAIESFAIVRSTVASCLPAGTSLERQRQCTMIVWATIDGLVSLEANRQVPASIAGTTEELAEQALRTLVRGWQ